MLRIIVLLGGIRSVAEASPLAMTLSEALAHAQAHQPEVRRALAEVAVRRREAEVPRAAWLPRIGAQAQVLVGTANNTTASYLNVARVDLPRIGGTPTASSTSWTLYPSTLAGLTVDQEIFDFGRTAALAAALDAQTDVAKARVEATRLDIALAVEQSFHAILAGREVLRSIEAAQRRAMAHRDLARAGVTNGLRPPIELTRAEAELAQLDVSHGDAEAAASGARAMLAAAVGADTVEVDAKESAEPAAERRGLEDLLSRAAADNPEIHASLARLRSQAALTTAVLRELAPNLFASATLSGRSGGAPPSAGDIPWGAGWAPSVGNVDVALLMQWTVFDGTVLARRRASLAREAVAQADVDVARSSVRLAATRAYLDLVAADRALPNHAAALAAARLNLAQADARFQAGLGTFVELADAEALVTRAELGLTVDRFAIARAQARLAHAIGQPPQTP